MDQTTHEEIRAGITAGLTIKLGSVECERLKDMGPNDARDPFEYGKLAAIGAADEHAAWERVAAARGEYRAAQVREQRAIMQRAREEYLAAKRTLRAWGE